MFRSIQLVMLPILLMLIVFFVGSIQACNSKIPCLYNDKVHVPKAQFLSKDGCSLCTCNEGTVSCTKKLCGENITEIPAPPDGGNFCYYNQRYYESGSVFTCSDGCNSCFCRDDGTVSSTLINCEAKTDPDSDAQDP